MKDDELALLGWEVFEGCNDAIFLTGGNHIVCEANPYAQRLTGFSRAALVGRSLFDLISGIDEQTVVDVVNALEKTGIFHSREQFCLTRQSGVDLAVNLSVSCIHAGTERFGVVMARDISERVRAARQLRESYEALEQRVSNRTCEQQTAHDRLVSEVGHRKRVQSQLERVNQKLTVALESLQTAEINAVKHEELRIAGRIAIGMAHEINNLVTPLLHMTELLEAGVLSTQQRQHVRQIKRCASDIGSTVLRLRELRQTSITLHRSNCFLPDLIQSVVDMTRPRWHNEAIRRGVAITVKVNIHKPASTFADESALRSVVANLVFNSIDALNEGGQITIECDQDEDNAVITVSDNGEGMDEVQLASCCEPFVSSRPHRCGLGLSLSKRIIEQHDGSLEIRSKLNQGTDVCISILIADPHASAPVNPLSISGTRFLFVEDNDVVRRSVQILLRAKGVHVDVAVDGQEALQLLSKSDYDVVISDLGLPGIDGKELLGKCHESWPHIQTVLVSGWIDGPHDSPSGPTPHITMQKPFKIDELFNRLGPVLDPRR